MWYRVQLKAFICDHPNTSNSYTFERLQVRKSKWTSQNFFSSGNAVTIQINWVVTLNFPTLLWKIGRRSGSLSKRRDVLSCQNGRQRRYSCFLAGRPLSITSSETVFLIPLFMQKLRKISPLQTNKLSVVQTSNKNCGLLRQISSPLTTPRVSCISSYFLIYPKSKRLTTPQVDPLSLPVVVLPNLSLVR